MSAPTSLSVPVRSLSSVNLLSPITALWTAFRRWLGRSAEAPRPPAAEAQQRDADSWMSKLVAGVVHEMNTPVGAMVSSADTIDALSRRIEAAVDDPAVVAYAQSLRRLAEVQQSTARRLAGTVGALERFVDLDRSDRRAVDLRESLESALGVLGALGDPRIRVDAPRYAPRPLTSARLLNRVLLHALGRALEAAGASGRIEVSVYAHGSREVAISIRDTGVAMSPEVLQRLGQPELTARWPRVRLDLGWATSQRALATIGGRMTVESHAGQGTTVVLVVPLDLGKIQDRR